MKRDKLIVLLFFIISSSCYVFGQKPKNVVFIICDDLSDIIHGFGGHPQSYLPNIDRLAKMSVRFTNAHSNSPMCGPSRPSMLSGLYPTNTGKLSGKKGFRSFPKLKDAVLFPTYFKDNGYQVYCAGKLFHGIDLDNTVFGASKANKFEGGYLGPKSNFGPYPWDGKTKEWGRPSRDCPNPNVPTTWKQYCPTKPWAMGHGRLSDIPNGMQWVYSDKGFLGVDGIEGGLFKYNKSDDRSSMPDELVADWAVSLLKGNPTSSFNAGDAISINDDQSFFISLGFIKTHLALYTPDEYYDAVEKEAGIKSLEDVMLPWAKNGKVQFNDLDDVAPALKKSFARARYKQICKAENEYEGGLKEMLQGYTLSYLAAANEIDTQVGKILDVLEETDKLKNTVIIFTSDHGYHYGDKESFFKYTLWEGSTRIPLIVYDPSKEFDKTRGKRCDSPVSLIDIYPTLTDLCNLSAKEKLEGVSLKPFLEDTKNDLNHPKLALIAIEGDSKDPYNPDKQKLAVRSTKYRYIITADGEEELYDCKKDPYEWDNIANQNKFMDVKIKLHHELCRISGRTNIYANKKVSIDLEL
jgi:arylsulfatase A-like enzyme